MPIRKLKRLVPFTAIKETLAEKYTLAKFNQDLMAGIVVGLVALPLGMALAISTGVAPSHGLYTVIIAGFVVALFGGSRCQVSGPTAAFIVILVPIVEKFGISGLLTAGLMAGFILIMMGAARMGQWIQYMPHPVTTGFTAGIGLVIATLQLKDFFGLKIDHMSEHWFDKVKELALAAHTFNPWEFSVAAITLFLLLWWPTKNKKIPAPLVALSSATILGFVLTKWFPDSHISTIASRFGEISGEFPKFVLPWTVSEAGQEAIGLTYNGLRAIAPSAFSIAILGAIESLLSAVVADGMAQTQHDPDAELIALGTGNIIAPFFGGIAATGAIARTATNIKYGGRSPVAGMVHAVFVLVAMLTIAPVISLLPMASLAALLLLVAYNMSDVGHFFRILKVAPRSDIIVLLICFGLTVVMDMVAGVTVGVILAALLMIRRISDMATGSILPQEEGAKDLPSDFPKNSVVYRIEGPFVFGAAQRAMGTLSQIQSKSGAVLFDLSRVPTMDLSGLVALETAVLKLNKQGTHAVFMRTKNQVKELIEKSGLCSKGENIIAETDEHARDYCQSLIDSSDLANQKR